MISSFSYVFISITNNLYLATYGYRAVRDSRCDPFSRPIKTFCHGAERKNPIAPQEISEDESTMLRGRSNPQGI